jgi:hypothetical protein
VSSTAIAQGAFATVIVATSRSPSGVPVATGTGVGGFDPAGEGSTVELADGLPAGAPDGAMDDGAPPQADTMDARTTAASDRSASGERKVLFMVDTAPHDWTDRKCQFTRDQ